MHLKLKVLRGASAGKEIPVAGPKFYIGRSEECQLRANSDAISRRHCAITVGESEVTIRDLGSRNGTYVNGTRIDGEHRIQMGDQLRVGPLEFLVTFIAVAKPAAPARQAAPSAKSGADDDITGMIDDWLSEGDDQAARTRVVDLETREFRLDDTNRIQVNEPQPAPAAEAEQKAEADEAAQTQRSSLMSQRPGANRNAPPKDTQEAAAQTLRKFFNRGGGN